MSKSAKERIKNKPWTLPDNRGVKNGMWAGNEAKYSTVHNWISSKYGKPKKCQNCNGKNAKSNYYDWANITGVYDRNIKNYIRLCRSCHISHDRYKKDVKINYEI